MQISYKNKIFILLIFIGIILTPLSVLAAKSKIGDTCTQWATNDDCEFGGANLDCQETSAGSKYFCTCYDDQSCQDEYGGAADGGDWKCISGNSNTNGLSFCKSTKGLIKKPDVANTGNKSCTASSQCPTDQYCLEKKCYTLDELTELPGKCSSDTDCKKGPNQGVCQETLNTGSGDTAPPHVCFFLNTAESISCGSTTCTKSDKACTSDGECTGFGGTSVCQDKFCWLDELSMKKYKEGPSVLGIKADLQIKKPILEINIPELKFSDVQNTVDSEGYIHLPYIGEYMSAIYKVAMVAISIIGVIMIIVVGVKITVLGGEERVNGFKRIGQIVIGLFIAWGSYAILYNINPDLVTFKTLKVKYIEPIDLQTISLTASDLSDAAIGEGSPDKFKYFNKCPVNLTQPIYYADGTSSLIPDLKKKPAISSLPKNIPRRLEFHDKMVTQQILKGSMTQRVAMATEAAAQCQIQYENCGVGTTNVYALAAATGGSYGASEKCLKHAKNTSTDVACNSLGNSTAYSPKTMLHDVTNLNTSYNLKVTQLTKGMICSAKCSTKVWPEPCFNDPDQATAKLVSILTATGKWDPNWINELQPGDYYMIVNWNPYCPGTHSALFLGWQDPVQHIAWVQMGDAANFVRVGTKKLGKEAIIQISRPKEK